MTEPKKDPKEFMKEVLVMSKMIDTNFQTLKLCPSFEAFEKQHKRPEIGYELHSWICFLRDLVEQQAALIAAMIYDLQATNNTAKINIDKVGNTFLKVSSRMKELSERIDKLEQENKS